MSKHREILPSLVEELSAAHPGCAILVGGSVSRGEERPDSDLDLFVVFQGDGAIRLEQTSRKEGIFLDIAYFPTEGFWPEWKRKPFNFWMFAQATFLADPTGIGERCQAVARGYFSEHQSILRLWEDQMIDVRRHKKDRSHALRFPTWADFAKYVERTAAGQ